MFNPFSLEGKNIIVTGASSGIGQQCAIDCSRLGATIHLVGRNEDRLGETLSYLEGRGHSIHALDLTDFDQVEPMVKGIVESSGKISGLLNCAGISTTLPFRLASTDKMDEFFRANVETALYLSKVVSAKKYTDVDGASIVFFASVMGVVGESGKMLYSMTKGALLAAMRSLALEFAKRKVRFNAVSPGVIVTPINQDQAYMKDPDSRARIEELHPLGLGQTTDISNACIYLLSDAARWVTGQNLIIDGGYTAR